MRRSLLSNGLAVVAAAVCSLVVVSLSGQSPTAPSKPVASRKAAPPEKWTAPRTPWGDPDLQGTYTNKDENQIPFERPARFEGKQIDDVDDTELAELRRERAAQAEAVTLIPQMIAAGPTNWYEFLNPNNSRAWLVVDPPDGRIPALTPQGEARARAAASRREATRGCAGEPGPCNGYQDFNLYERCISRGLPGSMMPSLYGNAYDIVQSPGYVAIRYEMVHETRLIPLDGRPVLGKTFRPFMGEARGRFEGDTLVIETSNFEPRTAYRNSNGDTLRLTERFKPVALDKVEWSVTVNDPSTWTRPWTFAMTLTKDSSSQVFEYGCHEGNDGLKNILTVFRAEEQRDGAK